VGSGRARYESRSRDGIDRDRSSVRDDTLERPAVFLLNGDEEVGSTVSRPITEKLARRCAAVFVLEPAQGLDGAYKTARKGVGDYTLRVKGVAAHAGVDFQKGHSAIHELAWQLEKVRGFTELDRGLTVNAGVIRGGTRTNVIAAEAEAEIDVRIAAQKMRNGSSGSFILCAFATAPASCRWRVG